MDFSFFFLSFCGQPLYQKWVGPAGKSEKMGLGLIKRKEGLCDMAEFDIHVAEDTNTEKEKERRKRHEYDEIVRCTLSSSRPKNI